MKGDKEIQWNKNKTKKHENDPMETPKNNPLISLQNISLAKVSKKISLNTEPIRHSIGKIRKSN